MARAAVAAKIHQAFYVHGNFAAEVTLNRQLGDLFAQLVHVAIGQIFDLRRCFYARSGTDFLRAGAADTVYRGQRDFGMLMIGNVYARNSSHDGLSLLIQLTLALFMALVGTDHAQHALASNQLAVTTDFFYRCLNSHYRYS